MAVCPLQDFGMAGRKSVGAIRVMYLINFSVIYWGSKMISQILAVGIFVLMFGLVISEKFEKHIITLACAAATLVLVFGIGMHSLSAATETLNVHSIFTLNFWHVSSAEESSKGINWATIIFIAGMMVMVEGMAASGFFRWLCITIAKLVKYKVVPILITFMIISGVLSMFIDSITVILFLAAVTVELAQMLKFDPIPVILSEIFCANLGGSATMCGDPPNIIIGTSLGFSFADFITNTGVIALISLIVMVVYFYLCFKKELSASGAVSGEEIKKIPSPKEAIKSKKGFVASSVIFALAIVLLITHAQTGLTVAFIGVFIAIITLIASGKNAIKLIKGIDVKTLLFFIGLFVVVGGLEQTGVLEIVANFIGKISGGNIYLITAIIVWVSGIASAFIDNIPFAATMIPVIKSLADMEGVGLPVLAWALSMGTDIGGSATPIGASANVVGISVAAKEGYPVGWGRYCKYMVPATVIVLVISTVFIWVRYI